MGFNAPFTRGKKAVLPKVTYVFGDPSLGCQFQLNFTLDYDSYGHLVFQFSELFQFSETPRARGGFAAKRVSKRNHVWEVKLVCVINRGDLKQG